MKQTLPSVRERLRIANEKLSQKNGVNPDDQYYIRKKKSIINAWSRSRSQ